MALQNYVVSFPELQTLLLNKIQAQLGSNVQLFQGGFLSSWVQMLSALGENDLFYTSMLANEGYLSRALLQSSILEHAKSLGYAPTGATPASGSVVLYIPINPPTLFQVNIPASQFVLTDAQTNITYSNSTQLQFYYDSTKGISYAYSTDSLGNTITLLSYLANVNTPNGNTPCFNVVVPVQQATWVNYTAVLQDSDVANNKTPQVVVQLTALAPTLTSQNYFIGTITVSVNAIQYPQYDFLFSIPQNTAGYVLTQSTDTITVTLGNGIFGIAQQAGATVYVQVPLTLGSKGNVIANALSLTSTLVDSFTGKSLNSFLSHEAITNGTDGETAGTTRLNAIRSIRDLDRMVTSTDFSDLIIANFGTNSTNTMFIDAYPITKVSDFQANETSVFIVPTVADPTLGNRAMLCNTIVYDTILHDTTSAGVLLIEQGSTIHGTAGSYTHAPDTTGICPFEVFYYSSPQWIDYRYLLTDVTLTPVTSSQLYHTNDYYTTGSVSSYEIIYDTTAAVFLINATLTLQTSGYSPSGLGSFFSDATSAILLQFPTYQYTFGSHTIFDLTLTLTDVSNAANYIQFKGSDWSILSWTDLATSSTVVLQAILPSAKATTATYKAFSEIDATLNNTTQPVHTDTIISIVFKSSLKELFSTSVTVDSTSHLITVYDVPIIAPSEWANPTLQSLINTALLSQLFTFADFVDSKRMLTNKVVTPFAKTWGTISNTQYNPSTSQYVYDATCIDKIQLPLTIDISIVVQTDFVASTVQANVQSAVWNFIQTKFGIQSNIYLKEIESIVLGIQGVLDVTITNPP
jgi:hypothetical protein